MIKKTLYWLIFGLIIFLSLFPRSVEVLNRNYLFGFDQGRDYLEVRDIIVNHKLTLIGSEWGAGSAGFSGLFHGPFHFYFLSVPFLLSNGDPYSGILLMFTMSILTIILGFYIGKKIFNNFGGIIIALLIAMSPPLISQARFVWNSHSSPPFILLSFYFIYRFIQTQKTKFIFLSAFFSAFIYNFQTAIAVPMCLALILFSVFVLKLKKISQYGGLFSGFLVAVLPFFLFEIRHKFLGTGGIINYLLHNEKTAVTQKFFELLLKDHLGTFIYNFYDTFPRQSLIPFLIMFLIAALPTLYYFLHEKNKHLKLFLIYLFMLPFVSFFIFSFLRNAVYPYYLIHLNLVYIILISYAFYSAFTKKQRYFKFFLIVFIGALLLKAIPFSIENSIADFKDYGGDAKIKGKTAALDYIYKDAKGEKFGLLVFTPPIYTYAYDYLLNWYGERKYGYIPHTEKKGLFYLLMEVDSSKPWSYKGWIETVVKNGKVIETKKLPSGFIVEKRYEGQNK